MAGIGESLQNERERKGLTLEEIAERTNIGVKALQALEHGEYKRIPGAFYFKNYIKNYVLAMDGDVDAFFETHRAEMESAFSGCLPDSYCAKVKYARFKKRSVYFSVAVTLLIFLGVLYIIYANKDDIFGGWTVGSERMDIPESMMRPDFIGREDNYSVDAAPVQIQLECKQNCWIQILRGKEKLADAIYPQGGRLDAAGYELIVSIGNPSGVRLVINGLEVSYLKSLDKMERLVINPGSIAGILKKTAVK